METSRATSEESKRGEMMLNKRCIPAPPRKWRSQTDQRSRVTQLVRAGVEDTRPEQRGGLWHTRVDNTTSTRGYWKTGGSVRHWAALLQSPSPSGMTLRNCGADRLTDLAMGGSCRHGRLLQWRPSLADWPISAPACPLPVLRGNCASAVMYRFNLGLEALECWVGLRCTEGGKWS